ncbi:hypothetical protein BGZ96_008891 [Linnemannia gamsii]|uniref:Mid2 domain-containing protein n=1 Tax=Linnemannia gamsii TaxID=64522 RepID=A0ABQ7JXD2_9FUNG|nr:hypothetical protein BGZ96_008891 [Linnemannia gamsii]
MRFTTLSLVLALFATLSATSTTTTTASPIAKNNDILLSRRHLYQRDGVDSQLTDTAIDYNFIPSSQLFRSSSSSGGARMINKRQRPRRLAGDKRGTTDGSLLDNFVDDLASPKPLTDESSHKGDTMTKRDDSEEDDDDDATEQDAEAEQLEQEQEEAITKEGDDNDEEDEDEEHTSGGQEPVPEDNTNTGSDSEPPPTTSSEEQEPTPAPEEDKGGNGNEEEPTLAPSPDSDTTSSTGEPEATSATSSASNASDASDTSEDTTTDPAPEPTDPAVAITSSSSSTTTATRKSGQTDPTVTMASKDGEVGPTTLPEHKEETNNNAMAFTAGAIVAAAVIASVIGIWIFRKWKLTPSRKLKSKITGGSAGAASVVYGSGKGQYDRSEYNSYDEIIRPEAYEIERSPSPLTPVSPAPAYPTAAAIGSEYEYGYAHYEQLQQLQQQQTIGNDTGYQQPSYHYGYNSGVVPAMSETSAMGVSTMTTSKLNLNVIGGVPATGHNIHGYGSEDYTQNDHFLRELRE